MLSSRIYYLVLLISSVSCRTMKSPSVISVDKSNREQDVLKTVFPSHESRIIAGTFDSDEPDSNENPATKAPSYRLNLGYEEESSEEESPEDDSAQDNSTSSPESQDETEVDGTTSVPDKSSEENIERKGDLPLPTTVKDVAKEKPQERQKVDHTEMQRQDKVDKEPKKEIAQKEQHSVKADLPEATPDSNVTVPGETKEKQCFEGDVMRVRCNTCVCSDGIYICSKKVCVDPAQHIKYSVNAVNKSKKKKPTKTQNKTVSFDEDIGDVFGEYPESTTSAAPIAECIDGRTKPVDCNQCICALGKWACTKMSCIPLTLREKASFTGSDFILRVGTLKENSFMDDDCLGGETKQIGCNQCVCHQNSWACTDLTCPQTTAATIENEIEEHCQTEEDVKSKECNICACRRGVWVCTKNDCKKFGNKHYHQNIRTSTSTEHPDEYKE